MTGAGRARTLTSSNTHVAFAPHTRPISMKNMIIALGMLALSACAQSEIEKPYAERTQRERDSVMANSRLPGAPLVKKAMALSDAQTKRMAELEEVTSEP